MTLYIFVFLNLFESCIHLLFALIILFLIGCFVFAIRTSFMCSIIIFVILGLLNLKLWLCYELLRFVILFFS